ncbi:hypothetical protein, partial [Ehrlichia ruminantium]
MQIQHKLSYQELVSCLRLIRTQHIGPSTFSAL